jgi:hypothetical protein
MGEFMNFLVTPDTPAVQLRVYRGSTVSVSRVQVTPATSVVPAVQLLEQLPRFSSSCTAAEQDALFRQQLHCWRDAENL